MTQSARAIARQAEDQAIQNNVQKIEAAKRPSALDLMANRLNISPALLKNTLMSTAFRGAKDEEFAALVIVANEYKLNPLTKEIYAFPTKGGGITPMVSIDGWVRIMNEHPQFDGIEFNDIPDQDGKLIAIEAIIYRKDRSRPIKVVEYLEECKRNTDPWNKTPARMLRHRALIQCARYAFGFSGIYSDDEAIGDIQLIPEAQTAPMRPARALPARDGERSETSEEVERELDARHDPETGEILDDDEQVDEEQQAEETAAEEEIPPYADKVTAWKEELASAGNLGDIKSIETEFLKDKAALPENVGNDVEAAITAARSRVQAAQS